MARDGDCLDVLIVGGGITGVALGLALHRSGLKVRVLDPAPFTRFTPAPGFDQRIYAVSLASQRLLAEVGGWQEMDPARIEPIRAMAVAGDGQGRLRFTATDDAPLGYIAEAGAMLEGLMQVVRRSAPDLVMAGKGGKVGMGSDLMRVDFQAIQPEESSSSPHMRSDPIPTIPARLLVAADGLQSRIRERLGIGARFRDYGQTAVVANYASDVPHQGVARQWFRPGEVVALLPLPGNHVSLVWSAQQEHAARLLALSPEQRTAALQDVVGFGVGKLREVSVPAGFPLRLMRMSSLTAPRAVLVGDAAHGVHPLAGQGLNLGLQDAAALAATLTGRGPGQDCGDAGLLRRYARSRSEPVLAMQVLTDGLFRLFGSVDGKLAWLRNWGMNQVDRQDCLKEWLVAQANR